MNALWSFVSGWSSATTTLDLSPPQIEDKGVEALARSPRLQNIRRLCLPRNGITCRGVEALARSPYAANLTSLDLADNKVGWPGVEALAQSPYLAALENIKLWGNVLGEEGNAALRRFTLRMAMSGPVLAAMVSLEPKNLFLLARLFREQGRVIPDALFAAILSTPLDSPYLPWLESQAEQVEEAFVTEALSLFPKNPLLFARHSALLSKESSMYPLTSAPPPTTSVPSTPPLPLSERTVLRRSGAFLDLAVEHALKPVFYEAQKELAFYNHDGFFFVSSDPFEALVSSCRVELRDKEKRPCGGVFQLLEDRYGDDDSQTFRVFSLHCVKKKEASSVGVLFGVDKHGEAWLLPAYMERNLSWKLTPEHKNVPLFNKNEGRALQDIFCQNEPFLIPLTPASLLSAMRLLATANEVHVHVRTADASLPPYAATIFFQTAFPTLLAVDLGFFEKITLSQSYEEAEYKGQSVGPFTPLQILNALPSLFETYLRAIKDFPCAVDVVLSFRGREFSFGGDSSLPLDHKGTIALSDGPSSPSFAVKSDDLKQPTTFRLQQANLLSKDNLPSASGKVYYECSLLQSDVAHFLSIGD